MPNAYETTGVGSLTIIVGWILTAIAFLSVIIYIWSGRVRQTPSYRLENILLYFSFLLSLALMSLTTWAVIAEGQGQHQSGETRSQVELIAKSLLINEILWSIVNTCLRIAAIVFIHKIFAVTRNWSVVTVTLLVVSAAYEIAVIITSLAICQPISASWDPAAMGRCGNEVVAYVCLEIISAIIDAGIVIAPLSPIMQLNMPLSRRWSIYVVLSLGSVVFIITGLRIAALDRVNSQDFSYDRGYIGLLSILGPLVTIICCCATATGPLASARFRAWAVTSGFPSLRVTWNRSTRPSVWVSIRTTKKNKDTEFGAVVSKVDPSEPTLASKSSETKAVRPQYQPRASYNHPTADGPIISSRTASVTDQPTDSTTSSQDHQGEDSIRVSFE